MIKDVGDLDVYNESLKLLRLLYDFIQKVPKAESDSISQIKRAAKSIPANISEGFAKRSSEKEFKRFLKIALGSSDEVITHLRTLFIALDRLKGDIEELGKKYKLLSKRINTLHRVWKSGYF